MLDLLELGSTVDPLLEQAPCDVTLVKDASKSPTAIVTLADERLHESVSARRTGEVHRASADSTLTLPNIQPEPDGEDVETDPISLGNETIVDIGEDTPSTSTSHRCSSLAIPSAHGGDDGVRQDRTPSPRRCMD